MSRIAVLGNITTDEHVWVDEIPPLDEVGVVTKARRSLGGRGAIVALVLRALGLEAHLCTSTGNIDTSITRMIPPWIWESEGDDLRGLFGPSVSISASATATRVLVCIGRQERNCISLLWPGTPMERPTGAQARVLDQADIIYCTTHDIGFSIEALRRIDTQNKVFIHNLSASMWRSPEYFELVKKTARIIIVNSYEASQLLEACAYDDPRHLVRSLPRLDALIITSGEHGADVHQVDGQAIQAHVAALEVPVITPVGAGDAFAAGVVAGIANNLEIASSCDLGARIAAISVSSSTSYPDLERIRDLRSSVPG